LKKCFVVQPFDGGAFDTRYVETFEPAIKKAGLEPYRVDNDLSVEVPIYEIHKNIEDSAIVFVEITLDNPNVWYELGYAMAKNKQIVMVCSDRRSSKFPFDIQHRTVINYCTQTEGDFKKLGEDITKKLSAMMAKTKSIENYTPTIVTDDGDLSERERVALALVMANQVTDDDCFSVYQYKEEMEKKGYNELGANLTLRKMVQNGYMATQMEADWNNNEYPAIKLTNTGISLMIEHEHEFVVEVEKPKEW
jgi:nucleoside 2-deoxyribosyltransferase